MADPNIAQIRDILVSRGEQLLAQGPRLVAFTGNPDSDALLNDLGHYPHAFVVACLMDRQWKAEKCWLVPYRFRQRFGSFEFAALVELTLEQVFDLFIQPPPLHRMKEVMATTFHAAIQKIGREYGGNAAGIWHGNPSSAALVRRFLEFRGAGPKIATMAANTLVREFKIPVSDKYSIDISPDVQVRRTLERLGLVRQDASNEELIYAVRELNPTYPGVFDLSLWEIGRNWCRPKAPACASCYMNVSCPTAKQLDTGGGQ